MSKTIEVRKDVVLELSNDFEGLLQIYREKRKVTPAEAIMAFMVTIVKAYDRWCMLEMSK